jgi:hypothetical protein
MRRLSAAIGALIVMTACAMVMGGCDKAITESTYQPEITPPLTILDNIPVTVVTTTTWTKANSPYRIVGRVLIPAGETLNIEPGVDVIFERTLPDFVADSMWVHNRYVRLGGIPAPFWVYGSLNAWGTETDSIRFLRTGAITGGLLFTAGGRGSLAYVRVADVYDGPGYRYSTGHTSGIDVSGVNTRLTMIRSVLDGGGQFPEGINVSDGATLEMSHSAIRFHHHSDFGVLYWKPAVPSIDFAISVIDASATIDECMLDHAGGGGLNSSNSRLVLSRSRITQNVDWRGEIGIYAYNCIGSIHDCMVTGKFGVSGDMDVRNCTLTRRWPSAVPYIGFGDDVQVSNSIIWDAGRFDRVKAAQFEYCIFPADSLVDGVGSFSADPLFVDPKNGDFRLQPVSPAIDAGDPGLTDVDGSRRDIGAPSEVAGMTYGVVR